MLKVMIIWESSAQLLEGGGSEEQDELSLLIGTRHESCAKLPGSSSLLSK